MSIRCQPYRDICIIGNETKLYFDVIAPVLYPYLKEIMAVRCDDAT